MHDWRKLARVRIAELNLGGAAEADVVEEVGAHLEDIYKELIGDGATEPSAYSQTLAELDQLYPLRANTPRLPASSRQPITGETGRAQFMPDLLRDVSYAFRSMRRAPLFVLFVVLTLALGIGANTTVFTLINTILIDPLPIPNASSLMSLSTAHDRAPSASSTSLSLSLADFEDYRARNNVFAQLAAYTSPQVLTFQDHGGASERLFGELVTTNYFSTLGLLPARGRYFLPDEDTPGGHPVAVINYGTWQGRFGGDPNIIGRQIYVNGLTLHIVGVAPPRFIGLSAIFGPDLFIPTGMMEQLFPVAMHGALHDRSKTSFLGVGRLKPGVNQAQAQANLAAISTDLAQEFPATDGGLTVLIRRVREILYGNSLQLTKSIFIGSIGLLFVVGVVLLIACSNVANLLLARAASRQQEMAVRLAMGASRARLIRQFLTESVLLSFLSGLAGMAVAAGGLRLLFSALPSAATFITPNIDLKVFIFALLVSLATGLVFGILPALRASRADVAGALKEEARTVGKSSEKVNVAKALLVGQVAFSFLLLVIAALFLRSIDRAYAIDPGFQTAHLDAFVATPSQAGYDEARTKAYRKEVKERVQRLPGVAAVAWSSNLPLWANPMNGIEVEGRQKRSRTDQIASIVEAVDPDYFDASQVHLDRGRPFNDADRSDSLPVAIVNEKFVHDFWPQSDALGKRIQIPGESFSRQIVGVARTASYSSWAEAPQLCAYVPLDQRPVEGMTLFVRTKGDPDPLLPVIHSQMMQAGPQVFIDARTGKQLADGGLFQVRIGVALLSVFGLLALGLASIGLYGILAYSVTQRKREIGLRMALGAGQGSVLRLILSQGMRLVLIGLVIGFVSAVLVGRLLGRMLYGIGGSDPLSVAAAAAILLAVALVACYLPARWASRVDPLVALREG